MKTNNNITQVLIYAGIFLATFGIAKLDLSDPSFDTNQRSYVMLIGAAVVFLISYLRIRKERAGKTR